MKLEDKQDLLSEKFFSEMSGTFFSQIHRVQKAIFRKGNNIFQEAKVPLQLEQFPILLTADAMGGLSQQEIADITHRDKSSIQRSIVTLERKGLIRIQQDENDKRRNLIYVTDGGKYLAEKIKELMKQAEEEAFAAFSAEERAAAVQSIKEIADKLENK